MQNFLKKYTFPFFETLCVLDGKIRYPEQHEARYRRTLQTYCGVIPILNLLDEISIPKAHRTGRVKLKVMYNEFSEKDWVFSPYPYLPINSLQCLEVPDLKYDHKFLDRSKLDLLLKQKGTCDDILILQKGMVRDSSYTNICFWTGKEWVTPQKPLLQGTMRARLIQEKQLVEVAVSIDDFSRFEGFKLINAMRDFNRDPMCPMGQIKP
jgi:4-amino-4-deoxychorismate lyase